SLVCGVRMERRRASPDMAAPLAGAARGMPASAGWREGRKPLPGWQSDRLVGVVVLLPGAAGRGAEGAGCSWVLLVRRPAQAGRSVVDELGPDGGRRSVSGGPLDGKPFAVSGYEVWSAWEQVRDNKGAPGVDGQSIAAFEGRLEDNLYKVWNRMSAGSYF